MATKKTSKTPGIPAVAAKNDGCFNIVGIGASAGNRDGKQLILLAIE